LQSRKVTYHLRSFFRALHSTKTQQPHPTGGPGSLRHFRRHAITRDSPHLSRIHSAAVKHKKLPAERSLSVSPPDQPGQ
ncbi:MAG: hypothetical protein ACJ788_20970, partial [Ktedonobacteraceae bacterium]